MRTRLICVWTESSRYVMVVILQQQELARFKFYVYASSCGFWFVVIICVRWDCLSLSWVGAARPMSIALSWRKRIKRIYAHRKLFAINDVDKPVQSPIQPAEPAFSSFCCRISFIAPCFLPAQFWSQNTYKPYIEENARLGCIPSRLNFSLLSSGRHLHGLMKLDKGTNIFTGKRF